MPDPDEARNAPVEREGGDPACWLDRVCPECGFFVEDDGPGVCGRCGKPFPGRE